MNIMRSGWRGLAVRFLLARTRRALLTAVGVALGAALLAAILTLGATLRAAVDDQMRAQYGTWDVMVAAPDLTTGTLAPATAAAVAAMPEVAYTVPVLNRPPAGAETPVAFYVGSGRFPAGQSGMRVEQGHEPGPGEVVLPVSLAQQLGAAVGGSVRLPFPDGPVQVRLVGLIRDSGNPATAFFDYTWLNGQLHLPAPPALLVGLAPGVSKAEFADRVHARFPNVTIDLREQLDKTRRNLGGFGSVGAVLGGGALIAAAFLVLGAFGITVQERTRELALLRAIGAGQHQVAGLMLREAVLIGASGALAGAGLGVAAAWATAAAAAHYLKVPTHALVVPIWAVSGVALAALLLAVAGAWPAVRRAGRIAPLAAMRPDPVSERQRDRAGTVVGLGLLLMACTLVGLSLRPSIETPAATMLASLAGLVLLAAVMTLLPRLLPAITRVGALVFRRWWPVETTVAQRSIAEHRHRAARAAGVLLLGLAIMITVASIVGGESLGKEFRLRESFPTPVQVTATWGSTSGFDDALVQALRQIHGVADVVPTGLEIDADLVGYDPGRATVQWVKQQKLGGRAPGQVLLLPLDYAALSRIYQFGRVEGKLDGGVVLTRTMARAMGLHLGETLALRLRAGGAEQRLTVTGLVDYLPEPQVIAADSTPLQPAGAPSRYRVAHVVLAPGSDPAAVKTAISALLTGRYAGLTYRDVSDLVAGYRSSARELMAMVAGAALIMLVIAGVGLANTVVATLHERRREMAVLRAIGTTANQVARMMVLEALLIGLAGSLLGVAAGVLVAIFSALRGWLTLGVPPALPATLIVVGLAAGPLLAVLVADRRVRAAAHQPLMRELGR